MLVTGGSGLTFAKGPCCLLIGPAITDEGECRPAESWTCVARKADELADLTHDLVKLHFEIPVTAEFVIGVCNNLHAGSVDAPHARRCAEPMPDLLHGSEGR